MSDGRVYLGAIGNDYRVAVVGRGTIREGRTVSEAVNRADLGGCGGIVIDLARCDYVDSTFLGTLVVFHKRFNGAARRFAVLASAERFHALAGRTHLDGLIPRIDSAPEPLAMREVPPAVLDSQQVADFVIACHRELAQSGGSDSASFLLVAEMLSREQAARRGAPPGASGGR